MARARRIGLLGGGMGLLVVLALVAGRAAAQTQPSYVWWEAESYAQTNLPNPAQPFPGDITQQEVDKLSGGRWVLTQGPESQTPYFLTYNVQVPRKATYNFWVRKFWKHGPFRWRFDSAKWATCGQDVALMDDTFLRKFIGANWIYLGQVPLDAGQHTLRIEMEGPTGGGAIDCFILTDGPFMPRGKLKPGQKSGQAMAGYFAWEPDADPLADSCPIDLRYLNEKQAGQSGFVHRDGNSFALGDGQPVRFWMVQADSLMDMPPQMMDYWARRLAKYGVNMVRLGMLGLLADWRSGDQDAFNARLDRLHYLVGALKRQGIYVYLGHLWWHTSTRVSEKDGFPGYGNGAQALALLYVNPKGREWYEKWVDALVNARNPYTDLPMAQDPAVAVVEIQNESSLFFWTFRPQNMLPVEREAMEKLFGDWAQKKYGSIDAALKAWGPQNPPAQSPDHPEAGGLGLYGIDALTVNDWAAGQRNEKRASDQLQFMTELQRGFYENMIRDWRQKLGVKNMIACSNWKTADPRNLGVLERYLYTAGDLVCRNTYYDVEYDPRPERFYAMDIGDTFTDYSSLKPPMFPEPLTVAHMDDWPDIYTENNWCRPNEYRSEWPFLVATYASMIGMDGWTFFSLDTPFWTSQMGVWEVNCPSVMGQFPADALLFRKGYVKESPPAVTQRMTLAQLYHFGQAVIAELSGKDALWVSRIGELEGATMKAASQIDRRAFFVGKINRIIDEEQEGVESVDLSKYIDDGAKVVHTLTGQLDWNYGTGIVTVNTPCAQGACGFLNAAGPIKLADVTIQSGNEYGSVLVISLDGKPLAESGKVLIQAGTEDAPYGFATKKVATGKEITNLGGYPMNVRKVDATVTMPGGKKAVVLDDNGYPTDRQAAVEQSPAGLAVTLPPDSLYTLVE